MTRIKRILIATDFSDCSKEALDYAVYLARKLGAGLYLLHVFEPPFYSLAKRSIHVPPEIYRWITDLKEDASKRLNSLADEAHRLTAKIHPILREGTPFLEILKAAGEIPSDLIVLGTHGRTGLSHFLVGSVAERVLRKASCQVFMVRLKALKGAKKMGGT